MTKIKQKDQPKKQTKDEAKTPTAAEYAGAISRWCDLHNATPDADGNRIAIEFERFELYLSALADENRRIANLKF